ncbi:hypothetical protein TH66_14330 [Carbonactinospora thermoautotrophica]|uniref:Uncharacterized protein n=1 Tax=Carbonactinospora thermoautotrophica TaxID=1469144 RepID=A0A132NCY5_9ACTN|nr:hypothetical protein [Carbonactinospora thermoautotrophica]KWX00103.1 hypothetical protein TH66_14330 [Carbonactinospora thermoautotrophica]KWX07432.1 hypothetical protein TR74_18820 [Carbonactinospora thermoautotrophica]
MDNLDDVAKLVPVTDAFQGMARNHREADAATEARRRTDGGAGVLPSAQVYRDSARPHLAPGERLLAVVPISGAPGVPAPLLELLAPREPAEWEKKIAKPLKALGFVAGSAKPFVPVAGAGVVSSLPRYADKLAAVLGAAR